MKIRELFENELIPKTVLARQVVKFFDVLNEAFYDMLVTQVHEFNGFSSSWHLDSSQPFLSLTATASERAEKPWPTKAALTKRARKIAAEFKLMDFQPMVKASVFQGPREFGMPRSISIMVTFQTPMNLDDGSLDIAQQEVDRLSAVKDNTDAWQRMTANF